METFSFFLAEGWGEAWISILIICLHSVDVQILQVNLTNVLGLCLNNVGGHMTSHEGQLKICRVTRQQSYPFDGRYNSHPRITGAYYMYSSTDILTHEKTKWVKEQVKISCTG